MPNSSTSDWKTMTTTAACQASGRVKAMGSTTKELRVPKLKVRVLAERVGSWKSPPERLAQ
ncbi:MAG: hypothetical protein ACQEXG_03520 [Pseudomonadota bacterium]